MSSRGRQLLDGIVDALQTAEEAERFTFDPVEFVKSYSHAWKLEDLEAWPKVYVRLASKTGQPASRIAYLQQFTIRIEIVGKIEPTNETIDGGAVEELERWVDFVDELERVIREDCKLIGGELTLLSYTADPLYETENMETMNLFQSFMELTYQITERNTLGA